METNEELMDISKIIGRRDVGIAMAPAKLSEAEHMQAVAELAAMSMERGKTVLVMGHGEYPHKLIKEGCIIPVNTKDELEILLANVPFKEPFPIKTFGRDWDDLMPKAIEYERYDDDVKPSFTNQSPTKQKKFRNQGVVKEYVRKPKPKKTHKRRK